MKKDEKKVCSVFAGDDTYKNRLFVIAGGKGQPLSHLRCQLPFQGSRLSTVPGSKQTR
jgi:hypothetical protein